MRSKLLSLNLVLTVLNSHMPLFVDPTAIIYSTSNNEATSFVQAINQYLCLCLSRNAVSSVPQVFEVSVEIFWRVLAGMRTKLKVNQSYIWVLVAYWHGVLERNWGPSARNLHPDYRNEDIYFEAKGCHSWHDIQTVPRPPGSSWDIPELWLW